MAAIAAYLPLNIYNGYFNQANLLLNMLKDLVFDGTLYHLWYLPASMLGMLIAWQVVQKLDYSKGLIVAGLLYLIGLFGDSYYGIAVKLPGVKSIYDLLFELFDYTRNGIFFAPVFLMLGGLIAEKKRRMTQAQAIVGLIGSFLLLIAEAMLLHKNGFQRHDSMYVFLLPCMVLWPPYQAVQPRKANYPLTITSGRNVALNSPLSFFWNNCEPLTNAD